MTETRLISKNGMEILNNRLFELKKEQFNLSREHSESLDRDDGYPLMDSGTRDRLQSINDEINVIIDALKNSVLIENQDYYTKFDGKSIVPGSFVKYVEKEGNVETEKVVQIVGYGEVPRGEKGAIDEKKVSYLSPFGIEMLKHQSGDTFNFRKQEIKILKVALTEKEVKKTSSR